MAITEYGTLPSLTEVARILGGEISGRRVRAPGPGHSALDRSLSIEIRADAPDGFLVHSFSEDDPLACKDYVRSKLGLSPWLPSLQASASRAKARLVADYIYRHPDRTPYLRVQRAEPKGAFPQSHWTGTTWQPGRPQGPKIPYRLPEVLAAVQDAVFVCEGEKDADALAARGLIATTNSEGAGKWTPDLDQWFVAKTVYILPDNDETGRRHAKQVAERLAKVSREVRIVELPNLSKALDCRDLVRVEKMARGAVP